MINTYYTDIIGFYQTSKLIFQPRDSPCHTRHHITFVYCMANFRLYKATYE